MKNLTRSREGDVGTVFLVLRRLRKTLIALVVIFAVSVLGMVLAVGPVDEHGEITHMSFFHAFYFISYTATTIGFGEIPQEFSPQQRLWALICVYLSVIGWAIFVASLLQISQDVNLQRAIRNRQFARAVRRLRESFYLVCGYGETGRRICHALDKMNFRIVVLEVDSIQLSDLDIQPYGAEVLALDTDASNPEKLQMAGLCHPYCRGVIALTDDDQANLAVAISARLMAPDLPVLARAKMGETADNMRSFDTHHVVRAVRKFGDYLSLAMHNPAAYHLLALLTGLPGTEVKCHRNPPQGNWVLCGYGNFGQSLTESITHEGLPVTVIDLHTEDEFHSHGPSVRWVQGDGTGAEILTKAGIGQASGLIAATSSDVDNLSIAVTARQLNPDIFIILRQNSVVNRPLIDSFAADITMVPSEIVAKECLAILSTPMLAPFLNELYQSSEVWCENLLEHLTEKFGWEVPEVWSVVIDIENAPALHRILLQEAGVKVCDIFRAPSQRSVPLNCTVLQLERGGSSMLLPDYHLELQRGDQLLLAGDYRAHKDLEFTMKNEHALQYVLTGKDLPGGWIWEKLASLKQ